MFQAGITRIRHLTYYTCLAPRPHVLKVPSTHGQGRKIPEPTGEQGGAGSRGHHLPTYHIYTHHILSCMVHTCIPGHKAGPAAHTQDSLTCHQETSHSRVPTPAGSRDPSPVYVGGRSPKASSGQLGPPNCRPGPQTSKLSQFDKSVGLSSAVSQGTPRPALCPVPTLPLRFILHPHRSHRVKLKIHHPRSQHWVVWEVPPCWQSCAPKWAGLI